VLDAPDARAAVHRLRDLAVAGLPRALPVLHAFQRAEGGDSEIAAATRPTRIAGSPTCGGLPKPSPRVSGRASRWPRRPTCLWALLDPTAVHRLVEGRGWTVRRWGDWFADAAERLLLR
jgi:hypothetical protein